MVNISRMFYYVMPWNYYRPTEYFLLIFTLAYFLAGCNASAWLALSAIHASGISSIKTADCDQLPGLINKQIQICKRNAEVMKSVSGGAVNAIHECQFQFANRRWNCSTIEQANAVFGNVLENGTREAAFVHAISSAAVAHSVTRACSSGDLMTCGCDRTVTGTSEEGFTWSGCSDNVAYGVLFSQTFVDSREKKNKMKYDRYLMNIHNNDAGRRLIEKNMRTECKCHGVSGSCEMKTCWRAMPTFRYVGEKLKDKFDGATEVVEVKMNSKRKSLLPADENFKPFTQTDLIYLVPSPDFCNPDHVTGSLGTKGRECNKTSKAMDGCDLMCCGRGFDTYQETITERCSCKFHWCCYVECKQCKKTIEIHKCK